MLRKITNQLLKSTRTHTRQLTRTFGAGGHHAPDLSIQTRQEKTGYFLDPEESARRVIQVLAAHPDVTETAPITLGTTWRELGVTDLGKVEIFLEIEKEFDVEFADEDVERSRDVRDAVEYVARSFHAH